MKLTKEKLEQLIMEEYKSMSRRIFDKRRKIPDDAGFTPLGHENRTIDYPEYQAKLTSIATSGPEGYRQAKELADKVGVVLNETMMNESSSLALSIYSPENLASLLEGRILFPIQIRIKKLKEKILQENL